MNLPKSMKALQLKAANKLELVELPIPKPGRKGQVLIKMAYSPINPSDLAFLTGQYGLQKEMPVVPGFEGSGKVIASGGGFYGSFLKGKNVACVAPDKGDGTWAEYMLTDAAKCVSLGKNVELDQGSMSFVNPLTAIELVEMAKKGGYNAIVMSAAASALSKMVLYQAQNKGIAFCGVVRKDMQVKRLELKGIDFAINTALDNWKKDLYKWAKNHQKVLFLDAVGGGDIPSQILSTLPAKSKMVVYGRLELDKIPRLEPQDFIFKEYEMVGYWLSKSASRKSFLQAMRDTKKVQRMLADGFQTNIQKKINLSAFNEAIKTYASNMSGGKVLFEM